MENSKPQLSSIPPPPENPPTLSPPPTHSDRRHSLIAGRLSDALFSALAAKYATNDTDHSVSFPSEQLKSDIERRLREHFPSFHTPTHLPYASMIQRAIAEMGEEDGLSEESISDFIVNEYEDLPWAHDAFLRRHLGKLCESGELVKSKCGRYKFKVESKGVKRKKRQRKSVGRRRRREVVSADEIEEDVDMKKRSKKLVIIGPRAEEVVTSEGTEELNSSLREVIVEVEDEDHAQGGQVVLDEVEEDEMIDDHHGQKIKYKDGPKDFNQQKLSGNVVIIGLHAPVTNNAIRKQRSSLREEVHEAKEGDHAKGGQIQVRGELKEVRVDVMINQHCGKEVKSRDGVQIFDERKQSQEMAAAKLGAQEALTMTGTKEKCCSSRKEIDGANRKVITIYELKEVRKVGINDRHEVEVKIRDVVDDFGGRKQLQDLVVVGLHAKESLTTKWSEDQFSSLREEIDGAEGDRAQFGQTEVLDKFKEVQEVEMIDVHHEEERQGEVGGRKQLQDLVVVGLHAKEALTAKQSEDQFSSLREEIDGVEGDRAQSSQTELLNKFKEVQEVEMIDVHHEEERQEPTKRASKGSNEKEGPSEEATLEFFDAMSNHGNAEANGVLDSQSCKKLLEENENLEFFDAVSDHGDNEVNEMIGAQSSEEKVLGEASNKQNRLQEQLLSKVTDDQTGISKSCEAEDPQPSKEQPQVRWPSKITGTPSTSVAAFSPLEHQTETLMHAEQGMPSTFEVDKNKNTTALLLSDIICSQPSARHSRGRPRKLKAQETLAASFCSSAQECDQQYWKSNVEDTETSVPDTGDGTHHVDQQRLKLPRRGRGRPPKRKDQISVSKMLSPSKHLHHQQSPEKRRRGRPPKRKFDEDTISSSLENEQ